jgi:hypothetical protein
LDHLRAGLITSEPLLAAATKAQPFAGGGSKAGPWGLTIRPSAFTAADTKIAVSNAMERRCPLCPNREIHQHEGCVRFVPKKRQRGVSSPNLCICCVTSSVSVDHMNPAGVKGEPGNVGTNAVICKQLLMPLMCTEARAECRPFSHGRPAFQRGFQLPDCSLRRDNFLRLIVMDNDAPLPVVL